jgi:hypothetical protein
VVLGALEPGPVLGQPAAGKFPVLIRGQSSQSSLKVDTSTTGNTTELGCETDQLNTVTVNGLTVKGAAAGANPTIAAKACTGGDTNIGITLTPLGTGSVTLGGSVSTFVKFYPAIQYCNTNIAWSTAANLIPVRLAANDWALARTSAGAETYIITCAIPLPWRSTAAKGARLDSFSISQQITVVALTSNTFNALATTTYANNVANAVAGYGGAITITPPTATQANPYLTAATLGTPAFMTTANTAVNLDFTVVMANTGVYRLYGIAITWSMAAY